jgi:ABC-type lipoprotein release transport system permease subunit
VVPPAAPPRRALATGAVWAVARSELGRRWLGLGLAHALLVTTRRRRRDLAVLRAVGFTPGSATGTVASMARTTATVALLAGLPVAALTAAGVPLRRAARLRPAPALRAE